MNRKNLMIMLVAFAAGLFVTACFSAPPVAEADATRAVLEENFQAANAEDLKRLMATISAAAPSRTRFAKESQDLFDRTDVYVRLDEFHFIDVDKAGEYAAARVVQTTLPKDEADRQKGNVYYANRSALLPEAETVEYTQLFKKERGQWKVYKINSYVRPVQRDTNDSCPNGSCPVNQNISTGNAFR
jgi:hypothetical protein